MVRPTTRRRRRPRTAKRSAPQFKQLHRAVHGVPVPVRVPIDPPALKLFRKFTVIVPITLFYDEASTTSVVSDYGSNSRPAFAKLAPNAAKSGVLPFRIGSHDVMRLFLTATTGSTPPVNLLPGDLRVALLKVSAWGTLHNTASKLPISLSFSGAATSSQGDLPVTVMDEGTLTNRARAGISAAYPKWLNSEVNSVISSLGFGFSSAYGATLTNFSEMGTVHLTIVGVRSSVDNVP